MTFKFCGVYKEMPQISRPKLPASAVGFPGPKDLTDMTLAFFIIAISLLPIMFFVSAAIFLLSWTGGLLPDGNLFCLGLLLGLIALLPLMLFQAALFPRKARVEFWVDFKWYSLTAYSDKAFTKTRFIVMSLAPYLLFGWLPWIVWCFLPSHPIMLLGFSLIVIVLGSLDYLNAFNALTRMPRGSTTQQYGFRYYWFYPADAVGVTDTRAF